jgi:hypothetical protein
MINGYLLNPTSVSVCIYFIKTDRQTLVDHFTYFSEGQRAKSCVGFNLESTTVKCKNVLTIS